MAVLQPTAENKLFISESGVVSLEIDEDYDIDLATRLFVKSKNDLKLEIKYPNLDRLSSSILGDSGGKKKYLKTVYVTPLSAPNPKSLCESLLGLYPNLAYDSIRKCYKLIVQGFVPNSALFKQHQLKIGDLIISINDVEITSDNIERVLASIVPSQRVKIVAVSPLTYLNLNTDEHVLRSLLRPQKDDRSKQTRKIVPSKSANVVKGDRVKYSDQAYNLVDECYIYVMILSLEQNKFTEQKSNPSDTKNDVIYTFPRDNMQVNLKKTPANELMFGLFETIRGLFMTLSYAVKDINKNDEAVCCSIQYQETIYHVSFLHKNFGKRGVLVLITPNESIDVEYFKVVSANLNETLKFTFGAQISRLINRRNSSSNDLDDEAQQRVMASEELLTLKPYLDEFFRQLNRRLIEATYFELFNNSLDDSRQASLPPSPKSLGFLSRLNLYREMRTKFVSHSVPYHDLPFTIKTDLDSALINLEAQEFVDDVERASFKTRRLFSVKGSCLFFKV